MRARRRADRIDKSTGAVCFCLALVSTQQVPVKRRATCLEGATCILRVLLASRGACGRGYQVKQKYSTTAFVADKRSAMMIKPLTWLALASAADS